MSSVATTSTPKNMPPATFAFNKLPAELRLIIWDMALHAEGDEPLVDTEVQRGIGRDRCVATWDRNWVLPTPNLVSPLLSVNVESRACTIAFYPLRLIVYPRDRRKKKRQFRRLTRGRRKGYIYLDKSKDAFLCIDWAGLRELEYGQVQDALQAFHGATGRFPGGCDTTAQYIASIGDYRVLSVPIDYRLVARINIQSMALHYGPNPMDRKDGWVETDLTPYSTKEEHDRHDHHDDNSL